MAGAIIWYVTIFGCAILFYSIGIYAAKLKKPMWFWSGIEVDASKITDIPKYNRENSIMWKTYSLWYFASGFAQIWSAALAITLLCLGCTAGIAVLIGTYLRIEKKYTVKNSADK